MEGVEVDAHQGQRCQPYAQQGTCAVGAAPCGGEEHQAEGFGDHGL